jgi:hypothetical protein
VFRKDLPKHNPTKLVSTQNSIPTENGDFPKINYTQSHFNYYCKNKSPKISKPVSLARYHIRASQKIGITQFKSTEPHIWIFD